MTRRESLLSLLAAPLAAEGLVLDQGRKERLLSYLRKHRRDNGGYGFEPDTVGHISPTFAVIGCYRLLDEPVPARDRVAGFCRGVYPVPERRRTERPLWRFDYEQVQSLLWLGESIDSFRQLAQTWTKPEQFTKAYELDGNPVFQHQAMAVQVRKLLELPPTEAWRSYIESRRRPNGTFNNTPASDGSDGHLVNTLWGVWASDAAGLQHKLASALEEWVLACQLPSGGFTYAPKTKLGGVEDVLYTWAAIQIIGPGLTKAQRERTANWIATLETAEGGYVDRPGGESNPVATFYALDSLRSLGVTGRVISRAAARSVRTPIPPGSKIYSIQIEAPGTGSPQEAVALARQFGVHIWAAKNSPDGWIAEARKQANAANVPVLFAAGNEEYGTFVNVSGLGTYSHLVDYAAPADQNFGTQLPKKQFPYPWDEFRDTRVAAIRRAGGIMVWQFNENEELTRILLDEATERGTYAAIASFHFGNENFLHSQPFLSRWAGRLPMVGLQDAHATEPWWWSDQLAGFTTLFLGAEPTWQAWLEALRRNHVLAVRHDKVSRWETQYAGGTPELRNYVRVREKDWRWWNDAGQPNRRLPGVLSIIRSGDRFEAGAPSQGAAVRLRVWADNTTQGAPQQDLVELVALLIDGERVEPELVKAARDRYYIHQVQKPGAHRATAQLRSVQTGENLSISTQWEQIL